MKQKVVNFDGLTLNVPIGWAEISNEAFNDYAPVTLADPKEGVGALQISIAQYSSGKKPKIELAALEQMISEFAIAQELGDFFDQNIFAGMVFGIGRGFHSGSFMVWVWYCSDGTSVALVTYLCDWQDRDKEFSIITDVVSSLRFSKRVD
jgi:hypothetical protein